mmetsp:Transcript_2398/g.6369  ORF Transcript_2398/g.6369 Transcript_2398/m.6369 type:complete len:256 (+) Transcript_2398:435-1202(+)
MASCQPSQSTAQWKQQQQLRHLPVPKQRTKAVGSSGKYPKHAQFDRERDRRRNDLVPERNLGRLPIAGALVSNRMVCVAHTIWTTLSRFVDRRVGWWMTLIVCHNLSWHWWKQRLLFVVAVHVFQPIRMPIDRWRLLVVFQHPINVFVGAVHWRFSDLDFVGGGHRLCCQRDGYCLATSLQWRDRHLPGRAPHVGRQVSQGIRKFGLRRQWSELVEVEPVHIDVHVHRNGCHSSNRRHRDAVLVVQVARGSPLPR